MYGRDGDGSIDSAEFLSTFFALSSRRKSESLRKHQKKMAEIEKKEKERIERRNKEFEERLLTRFWLIIIHSSSYK